MSVFPSIPLTFSPLLAPQPTHRPSLSCLLYGKVLLTWLCVPTSCFTKGLHQSNAPNSPLLSPYSSQKLGVGLAVLVTRWVNLSQERLRSPFHFRSNVMSSISQHRRHFALHLSISPALLLKEKEHHYCFPRTPKIRLVTPTFMCKVIHRDVT